MSSDDVIVRLTHRLFGSPILRNDIRGEVVDEIVGMALEPEWELCSGDWAAGTRFWQLCLAADCFT